MSDDLRQPLWADSERVSELHQLRDVRLAEPFPVAVERDGADAGDFRQLGGSDANAEDEIVNGFHSAHGQDCSGVPVVGKFLPKDSAK